MKKFTMIVITVIALIAFVAPSVMAEESPGFAADVVNFTGERITDLPNLPGQMWWAVTNPVESANGVYVASEAVVGTSLWLGGGALYLGGGALAAGAELTCNTAAEIPNIPHHIDWGLHNLDKVAVGAGEMAVGTVCESFKGSMWLLGSAWTAIAGS